jgi:hypothetical protein
MLNNRSVWLTRFVCATLLLIPVVLNASDTPANVAGTWTVSVSGGAGSATQTLVVQQDGAQITGTFKGPRQSGTLEGTVTGNAVTFHVKARVPLDYNGTADGDTMKGTLSGGGRTGEWTAVRTK